MSRHIPYKLSIQLKNLKKAPEPFQKTVELESDYDSSVNLGHHMIQIHMNNVVVNANVVVIYLSHQKFPDFFEYEF